MPEPDPPKPENPRAGLPPHEMPDVKPLIEKAGAERDRRVPQGTIKTGADIAGGGGTKTLDDPPPGPAPGPKATPTDGESG